MKNLMLGAAVSAALFGNAAQAAITLDANGFPVINRTDTYEIFLSGSSAVQPFIESLLTLGTIPLKNRICDSTKTIYKYTDRDKGSNQVAYLCEMNAANGALGSLVTNGVKKNLLFYKRNNGGSGQGVAPVIADSVIDFLKVDLASNCSTPVAGPLVTIACDYTPGAAFNGTKNQRVKPDFGISDVDPIQFQGDNKPSGLAAVTDADLAKLTVKAAAGQVFGISVTKKLRDAMQQAEFGKTNSCVGKDNADCMPNLSSDQIASIFSGRLTSWKQIKLGATKNLFGNASASYLPASDRVHVCRRSSGSGTQAQLGIKFLRYPCAFGSLPVPPSTDIPTPLPESTNQTQIHSTSTALAMSECLAELDSGTNNIGTGFNNTYVGSRWAIGIQGTEQNADRAFNWRFIKVDRYEPTLAKVVSGRYKDWVELTYQYNNSHVFDNNELAIINEVIKETGNPGVLAATNTSVATHAWGKSGFLATPQLYTPPATGIFSATRPVNPYSHGTTKVNTNNCRIPIYYKTGNASAGIQY